MKHYPYIIIGQGLAGTMLSMQMTEANIKHLVVDKETLSASSKIAAGLANPIVLKRLKWVKDAELFTPALNSFYKGWEKKLKTRFWHPITLNHIFHDTEEVNHWMEKSDANYFKNHLGSVKRNSSEHITAPYGIGELHGINWLNTSHFLSAYRKYLETRKQYLSITLNDSPEAKLKNIGITADTVIYCTGHLLRKQFPALEKCFTPTRGEVIVLNNTEIHQAWHKAIFALPIGNGKVKIGASYAHDVLEDISSEEGKSFLIQKLKQFYSGPYTILSHKGGVRPNISDRKPILGQVKQNTYVFNGMGSRGVLMLPYLGELMLKHLQGADTIPSRWNLERFISN